MSTNFVNIIVKFRWNIFRIDRKKCEERTHFFLNNTCGCIVDLRLILIKLCEYFSDFRWILFLWINYLYFIRTANHVYSFFPKKSKPLAYIKINVPHAFDFNASGNAVAAAGFLLLRIFSICLNEVCNKHSSTTLATTSTTYFVHFCGNLQEEIFNLYISATCA